MGLDDDMKEIEFDEIGYKAQNKDSQLRIFKDPLLVLSKAINKPSTEKVGMAILNLQKMGGIDIIKLFPD